MNNHEKPTDFFSDKRWILLVFIVRIAAVSLIILLGIKNWHTASFTESLTPFMTYEVVNTYPHDPGAFTQGLIFRDGYLYESTGLYGQSSLRKVELEGGKVLRQVDLPDIYFAEGLTSWENQLIQLTWLEGMGLVYAIDDFSLVDQFNYPMEGWGLTHDGDHLIMSDGTANLYFLSPTTYEILGDVTVRFQGEEITLINELEYIDGEVFANLWMTDQIIRIDPETGEVVGWIDLTGLLPDDLRTPGTDFLNGIAFDTEEERLFLTGKRWPLIFEIRLIPVESE